MTANRFRLRLELEDGECVERGEWLSLTQAVEQGRLWLETLVDARSFRVFERVADCERLVYSELRPGAFTPLPPLRPSALAARTGERAESLSRGLEAFHV